MYDRAPRTMFNQIGSTAETVGPGTYDGDSVGVHNVLKIKSDGYAPFLSMTSRESVLNPTDQVIAAPGPGHYDPSFAQDVVLGGKTLANKSKRFGDVTSETPGPGSYTLSKRADWLKETGRSVSAPSPNKNNQDKGNIMTNRIKFHRKPEAPSIPTPGQAYGYEENEDGTLVKQDAPDKDNSMGPAYYSSQHDETKPTKVYHGIHFGNMTSQRTHFGGKDGPGPGEYDPFADSQLKVEHINIHGEENKRYDARLPRYHEWVVQHEEKKAVPGPGKYQIRGQFDRRAPKVNTEGVEVEHPPFGTQAKRFGAVKTLAPAPGTYNDPRNALEGLSKITGLKRSPFGQTSVRFNKDHHIKKTPGPGSYNYAGMGTESMRKAYIESTRRGAFGTTSLRCKPLTTKDAIEVPGPSHYAVKEKPFEPRYQQLSSTFASLSNRLQEPPPTVKELPPPGSYDVHKSYQKTQSKMDPGPPRTENAKKKQGAFKSSSSRFAPPRDILIASIDPATPGPGTYEYNTTLQRKGGLMVTKDHRFRNQMNDNPGPGSYEYSPLIQDTVLKGTFNATLNNPIAPSIESMHSDSAKHQFLLGV